MAEAGGTTTLKQLTNVGDYTLWELKNSSWSDTETITIPNGSAITAGTQVLVVGALEETAETQGSAVISVSYSETNTQFTANHVFGAATSTDKPLRILFYSVNE